MIGLSILSFFVALSLILSSITTYGLRVWLFEKELHSAGYALLAIIAAIIFSAFFMFFTPMHIFMDRDKTKESSDK